MIGVISDHAARYTWFSQCLAALDKPEGTKIEWRTGANRGFSRDSIVHTCITESADWVFFIDDDQVFQPDVLYRLLARQEPVVSALIIQRGAPFLPTAYASKEDGKYSPLDLRSVSGSALVQVAGVGSGGLLVRREVFEVLDPPWFLYTENFGEDLYFSGKCEEAGIQLLVDTGCRIGHLIPASVIPAWFGDRWGVGIQLADGTTTAMEMQH